MTLRRSDLTENTFRRYVKHFMDNLRYLNFSPKPSESDLEEDSDTDSIAAAIDKTPMTPTKERSAPAPGDERTPRLSRYVSALLTPRPRPRPGSASHLDHSEHVVNNEYVLGCTLSFLLRVLELSNLARRVVQAELRNRERTRQSQSEVNKSSSRAVDLDTLKEQRRVALPSSTEGSLPKVRQLVSWAIRKFYQDGSIIIWDGPGLSVSVLEPHMALDSSMLYRSSRRGNTGRSSSKGLSSRLFSRHSGIGQPADDDSMEDLSDPPSDEEAYASLSTAYLATQVEQAIRSLTVLQTTRRNGENENTYGRSHLRADSATTK